MRIEDYDSGYGHEDEPSTPGPKKLKTSTHYASPITPRSERDISPMRKSAIDTHKAERAYPQWTESDFPKLQLSTASASETQKQTPCDGLQRLNQISDTLLENAPPAAKLVQKLMDGGICNLQREMPIPRVAVMGEQSHGKSSLFEALTGLDWPRGQGKTTSFPTSFTKLKKQETTLQAKILPSCKAKSEFAGKVAISKFANKWDNVGVERLADMIEDASSIILHQDGHSIDFSDWHLCITYSSPDNSAMPITFVDTPGIVATGGLSGASELVQRIVGDVIKAPNTLMLHVVQGSVDLDTVVSRRLLLESGSDASYITIVSKIDQELNPWVFRALSDECTQATTFLFRGKTAAEIQNNESASPEGLISDKLLQYKHVHGADKIAEAAIKFCLRQCEDLVSSLHFLCLDREEDVIQDLEQLPCRKRAVIGSKPIDALRKRIRQATDLMRETSLARLRALDLPMASMIASRACAHAVRSLRDIFILSITEALEEVQELKSCRKIFEDDLPDVLHEITQQIKADLRPSSRKTLEEDDLGRLLVKEIYNAQIEVANYLDNLAKEKILGNDAIVLKLIVKDTSADEEALQRRQLESELVILRTCNALIADYKLSSKAVAQASALD